MQIMQREMHCLITEAMYDSFILRQFEFANCLAYGLSQPLYRLHHTSHPCSLQFN
uniref:Uncharacterized protein n=1 Tax=Anguilla anguilla TaxID=7936 RepID=A0A0E9PRG0_ANGAN